MRLDGFNASDFAPSQSYEPIPEGTYKAVITESEEKPTKAGTGSYMQLTVEIIDGQHSGRKLIDRLNLNNPNKVAVDIAQRTLSSICRATGVMTPTDSQELHDKPMMVKVVIRPAQGEYSASNEIKSYMVGESIPAQAATSSKPSWAR